MNVYRNEVIESCAAQLEAAYPGHVWLNAACAAIRQMKEETNGMPPFGFAKLEPDLLIIPMSSNIPGLQGFEIAPADTRTTTEIMVPDIPPDHK